MADPGENLTGALHSNFGCGGWVWLAWKWDSCNDVVKQNPMISIFRKLLRQFSRHMFCYANQMSKALPRKRHAELEELDFKL